MIYSASLQEQAGDKFDGNIVIKTKEELHSVVADSTHYNKVVLHDDFVREYFTSSGLDEFLQNARILNKNLVITVDGDAARKMSMLEAIKLAHTADELVDLAIAEPREFYDSIMQLSKADTKQQQEALAASNSMSRLQVTIDELRNEIENYKHRLQTEQLNKAATAAKLDALIKRINVQYNIKIDESKLFEVDSNRFDKVIYIKEYSRVQFMDSFIYYLKEIAKILYNMPTRLVVIESFYGTLYPQMYPELTPHFKLTERDVMSGDILMLGLQPNLMADILKNASGVSLLIVLDRGGYALPHLRGKNIEYLYSVSDLKDISVDIPRDRIFSYSEDTLYIPFINGFDKLDSSEKISRYSSMKTMQKIIRMLEGK